MGMGGGGIAPVSSSQIKIIAVTRKRDSEVFHIRRRNDGRHSAGGEPGIKKFLFAVPLFRVSNVLAVGRYRCANRYPGVRERRHSGNSRRRWQQLTFKELRRVNREAEHDKYSSGAAKRSRRFMLFDFTANVVSRPNCLRPHF